MEVATLTAVLSAETAKFMAAMKAADKQLAEAQRQMGETESAAEGLEKSLESIGLSGAKLSEALTILGRLQQSLGKTGAAAGITSEEMEKVALTSAQAVATEAAARAEVRALHEIRDAALEAAVAERSMGDAMGSTFTPRGAGGRFVSPKLFSSSDLAFLAARDTVTQMAPYQARRGLPYLGTQRGEGGRFISYGESLAAAAAARAESDIGDLARADARMRLALASIIPRGVWVASRTSGTGWKRAFAPPGGFALGGPDNWRQIVAERDAMLVGTRGGGIPWWAAAAASLRGAPSQARGLLAEAGWGGRGTHWRRMFGVGGFGGGRLGLPVPPHARFGSLLDLAGFGALRMAGTTIGIGGSFLGGLLGGGLLAGGALGTMAVGAGTNMAGMGQAIGNIHTTSADLDALNSAIAQYGKNSIQAAQAQAQLNYDLKGFQPVARNAILAASQTSQAFGDMFHQVTGQAVKTASMIVQQATQVGMKFLPTIGRFAAQNMHILQHGLQPFFSWLTRRGNVQGTIHDVNRLNEAIKQHGAHSIQATRANQQLNAANQKTGGLGLFTDLEKIFQAHFPTAIHAGEQGFELLMKTIDLAAQHLGHFLGVVNTFLTKMNNNSFGTWAVGVEHLISLFHSWLGMFVALGKVVFSVFRPAVGLGKAFAEGMTHAFDAINKYLKQPGTHDVLHKLFSAHLYQLIQGIGALLSSLLPIAEQFISAFLQIEAVLSKAFGAVLKVISQVIKAINSIPGADKMIGYLLAFSLIFKVNALLLSGPIAGLLGKIPIIGAMFARMAVAASKGILFLGAEIGVLVKTGITSLLARIGLIGPLTVASAEEATAGVVVLDEAMAAAVSEATVLDAVAAPALLSMVGAAAVATGGILILVAALGAAYYLMLQIKNAEGSFPKNPLAGVSKKTIEHHKKAYAQYEKYLYEQGQIDPSTGKFVPLPGHHAMTFAQWYEKTYHKPLTGTGSTTTHIPGMGAMTKQERKQMEAMLKSLGIPYHLVKGVPTPGAVTTPGSTPRGYLNKQQAETAQARILVAEGHTAAAKRLLDLEKKQLQSMLKTAKTQAERTAILNQLATVAAMLASTRANTAGGVSINGYTLPLALQEQIARADALAALNPNLQGPTNLQVRLARQAKAAAMRVIQNHSSTMQQLIDAWNIVGQMNSIIAQRLVNKLAMYHKTSTDTVTDMIKGLTLAQELQLQELMAQRDAHRGYAPNQGYQPGSTPASHHRRRHPEPRTGRHHTPGVGTSSSGGTTIHIDTVQIHGVQNVRQLASEIEKLARHKYQRSGGRR